MYMAIPHTAAGYLDADTRCSQSCTGNITILSRAVELELEGIFVQSEL
jgi:hypothetical protein